MLRWLVPVMVANEGPTNFGVSTVAELFDSVGKFIAVGAGWFFVVAWCGFAAILLSSDSHGPLLDARRYSWRIVSLGPPSPGTFPFRGPHRSYCIGSLNGSFTYRGRGASSLDTTSTPLLRYASHRMIIIMAIRDVHCFSFFDKIGNRIKFIFFIKKPYSITVSDTISSKPTIFLASLSAKTPSYIPFQKVGPIMETWGTPAVTSIDFWSSFVSYTRILLWK